MESTPLLRSNQVTNVFCCSHGRGCCCAPKVCAVLLGLSLIAVTTIVVMSYMSHQPVYSYYLFTRRWPPSNCESADKCVPAARNYTYWTIHGLWPEFSNNTWDQFCRKDHLDLKVLEPIKSRLLHEWPNLLADKSDSSLWQHEWLKHGTCTNMIEFDYFNRTLDLNTRYPLTDWLQSGEVVPSTSRAYNIDDVHQSIASHFPLASVSVDCQHSKGHLYLSEIMLCFRFVADKNNFEPTECTVKSTCHGPFKYVPFGANF